MFWVTIFILLLEVLYYSMFTKFARDGSFSKYLALYILITILFGVIGTNKFYSYMLLVLTIYIGFRYFANTKTSLYDMLMIIVMLFTKVLIETPIYYVFVNSMNRYLISIVANLTKIFVIICLRYFIRYLYDKFKIIWDKNNFYIRYIFSVLVFAYCIITTILFIIK